MSVYQSRVTGYTGIAIKGGSVSIVDSEIEGTGAYTKPTFGGSGFSDTGDAVYIETNYGYEIVLKISGDSKLTSTHGKSLQVYEENSTNVLVQIESGTFSGITSEATLYAYIAKGSTQTITEDGVAVVTAAEAAE